ncbi:hypothetical protein P280DRAFT_33631 [Massarina eburnea CBS 473.64]|uniref:Uncharacterized protein n=1 Tax=Massarina eburnea CBS 473.64 TaxID=1395130 RepID=A0A6A6RY95_9PLEO|nr:hypothetical protein P280DRAFT_33631 [Massarina eburnea CBS 473.64]
MRQSILYTLPLIGAAIARPDVWSLSRKREVPQEHAHRNVNLEVSKSLNLDNPDKIQDPIFGLLGAAAGIKGAGNIKDADCLQQATADQAFTNAKAANDVNGMTFAMIYRALERNSGSVGLASVPCKSIQAVNPEIAALQQHQDPAGDGAQALNKQIAQTLASQISAIGGDTTLANEASTFAPGQVGDQTGAGNTCDDDQDDLGCINSQNLRVDDLTAAEIQAAASGAGAAGASSAGNSSSAASGNASGNSASGNSASGASSSASNDASAGASTAAAGAADFGSCTDPTVTFGTPSDGRKEDAFEATDLTNFPHGSALNIGVISSFICDQLTNKCKASADAVTQCDSADAAVKASGLTGQDAADNFNQALGF